MHTFSHASLATFRDVLLAKTGGALVEEASGAASDALEAACLLLGRRLASQASGGDPAVPTFVAACYPWPEVQSEPAATLPFLNLLRAQLRRLGVPFGQGAGAFDVLDARRMTRMEVEVPAEGAEPASLWRGHLDGIARGWAAGGPTAVNLEYRRALVPVELKTPKSMDCDEQLPGLAQAAFELLATQNAVAAGHCVLLLLTDGADKSRLLYASDNSVVYSGVLSWSVALLRVAAFLKSEALRRGNGTAAAAEPGSAPATVAGAAPAAASGAGPSAALDPTPAASEAPSFSAAPLAKEPAAQLASSDSYDSGCDSDSDSEWEVSSRLGRVYARSALAVSAGFLSGGIERISPSPPLARSHALVPPAQDMGEIELEWEASLAALLVEARARARPESKAEREARSVASVLAWRVAPPEPQPGMGIES